MFRPILRRLFSGLAAIALASLLAMLILEASPGDVVHSLLGDSASLAQQQVVRAELGLDQPLVVRYISFLGGLVRGDLGVSAVNGRPVAELIGARFVNTLLLTLLSVIFAVVVGVSLGSWAALRHTSRADLAVLVMTAFLLAVPAYGVALALTHIFSLRLGWLPAAGGDTPLHFILPCLSLALPTAAVVTRMVRARMLEELAKPYVTTALSKGAAPRQVWRRHVLPNAVLPAITIVGLQFGHLLGGAFIVETIFAWPGLGRLTVEAIFDQDYPVVLGAVVLSAVVYQVLNTLVDIAHERIDPRTRGSE